MAPRRSPRLHPSGSSSGSSGPAPPSSSPQSSDVPSDSDSDFEAPQRRRPKRGPPRGPTPVPKRSRGSEKEPEEESQDSQNSLFEAVLSGKPATEALVDEWLEWYRRDRDGAFLELLNFSVRCCGCRGAVSAEMLREMQNSQIIQRLTQTFQEASPDYPLALSSLRWRRFRAALCSFPGALLRRARHRELLDGFLVDSWLAFLTGLCDSQVRAFRHTATLTALKLMSALVEVALAVGQQLQSSRRQLAAEQGKEPARRGPARLELLQEQQRELREQQQELELLMNGIFKGVFVHRYRDVVGEIRALCLEELGLWVRKFPGSFLSDGHLKYLGWSLFDKHGDVRLRCVRALRGIYGIPEAAPSLELFTDRFKPRLVAMAHDKEPEVALEVLKLLTELDRRLPEALTEPECRSLFPVVFVSSRALATAAGELLCHRLLQPDADSRTFLLRLVRFFLQSELHEHGAYLVDSLWDCAGSRLRDWAAATALLLEPQTELQFQEEQALLELLSCSGRRLCRGQPPPGRGPPRKVSPRERRELRQEKSRLSRALVPVLPQLLQKFSAEPEPVAALLELLQELELSSIRSERLERVLEQILAQIQELFLKHSRPFPALSAASRALRALCEPGPGLGTLGDIARGRLGDILGDRCHLQVTELLQAVSPDEEDVYGLAATLRRLSALFNEHDLTPWGLFQPLARLLRHSLDSGDTLAQVAVPAVSCLFFHLFWELSRIPDSGAPPAQLRDFRARCESFVSLCQRCLAESDPGLRESAFLCVSDLLLLLGPGLPLAQLRLQAEPALQAHLGLALSDLVFNGDADEAQLEAQLEALHRRRLLLAAFCKLLLRGALPLGAASDVFKHYGKFQRDFGDIIRETLRGTRERDRPAWARTVLLSLQQLFTELLLQEGPRGLRGRPRFQELRELGRRLAPFFSLGNLRGRKELLFLHSEGIQFSLQAPPQPPSPAGIPGGLPLNLPFLEVLSEFSARLLRPDRGLVLSVLERALRERGLAVDFGADLGDFGTPLLCYRRSLSPPETPPGPPRAKRARESGAPPSSSPWPPSPDLTSTQVRGGPQKRGPAPAPPSSESRRTWGSRLSLMEEEEEEEEEEGEESPESPKPPLERPRDLFGSSSPDFQTF